MEINDTPEYKTFSFGLDRVVSDPFVSAPGIFNKEEIKKIIEIGENNASGSGLILGKLEKGSNTKIRNCSVNYLYSNDSDNYWIFSRIRDILLDANSKFYNFDLHSIQTLQFTKYDAPGEFYGKHIDIVRLGSTLPRKLSFTVQLSTSESYEGGDLKFYFSDEPSTATREQGTIHIFPSYFMHEVTPVTHGVRYSLVGWADGPAFK